MKRVQDECIKVFTKYTCVAISNTEKYYGEQKKKKKDYSNNSVMIVTIIIIFVEKTAHKHTHKLSLFLSFLSVGLCFILPGMLIVH